MILSRRRFHRIFIGLGAANGLRAGTAVLECVASRVATRRASLEFRVTLVAGWHPTGAVLLVHSSGSTGRQVAVDVSVPVPGQANRWTRTRGRNEGEEWIRIPLSADIAAALIEEPGRVLELRWRDGRLRMDGRDTLRYAPYLIVEGRR